MFDRYAEFGRAATEEGVVGEGARLHPVSAATFFFFKQKTAYEIIVCWSQTCALPIRSEEHTSEIQSHDNLVCRLLLGSEEHTSELQSHDNLVCRLLLEKKNNKYANTIHSIVQIIVIRKCHFISKLVLTIANYFFF